jgi:hypothetical protein
VCIQTTPLLKAMLCVAVQAPEQFEGCAVTDKVDVFAFAVLLWNTTARLAPRPIKELSELDRQLP